MFGCCENESTLNHTCLTILSYVAVYNRDTYAHVSSASVSNVCISFIMLKIKQHLYLEVAIPNFFKKDYRKFQNLRPADSVNAAKNDLTNSGNVTENDWTDWQFSVSRALMSSVANYIYCSLTDLIKPSVLFSISLVYS